MRSRWLDFLASKLGRSERLARLAAEWRLESPQLISLNGGKTNSSRGRIDLILAQTQTERFAARGRRCLDRRLQTGNVKPLTPPGEPGGARTPICERKLVRGEAIQLGLYGWPHASSALPTLI